MGPSIYVLSFLGNKHLRPSSAKLWGKHLNFHWKQFFKKQLLSIYSYSHSKIHCRIKILDSFIATDQICKRLSYYFIYFLCHVPFIGLLFSF